jgi:hypothetical protein
MTAAASASTTTLLPFVCMPRRVCVDVGVEQTDGGASKQADGRLEMMKIKCENKHCRCREPCSSQTHDTPTAFLPPPAVHDAHYYRNANANQYDRWFKILKDAVR